LRLSVRRLYKRLRPDDEPVLLKRASILERNVKPVKPRPMIPLVP
jgi:hypothetical protein